VKESRWLKQTNKRIQPESGGPNRFRFFCAWQLYKPILRESGNFEDYLSLFCAKQTGVITVILIVNTGINTRIEGLLSNKGDYRKNELPFVCYIKQVFWRQ
jgi:hypothetical protein